MTGSRCPGDRAGTWSDWRWQFRHRIRDPRGLAFVAGGDPGELASVVQTYPPAVTPYYLSLADPSDPEDPILRQCVPHARENEASAGHDPDPLEEGLHMPAPGLVHRYANRCLLLVTGQCAVHCRHCNRKRLWRDGAAAGSEEIACMVAYIARNRSIREVILSGGDPLTLGDRRLAAILEAVRSVPHVEVIRIGSRIPVVLPMRVTEGLCRLLRRYRPLWLNTHFNHVREITAEAARACGRLVEAGIPVCNQAVLLRGVNDSCESLKDLFQGLQRISVKPYYLFQCDPVSGTGHFHVSAQEGTRIMARLWEEASGLCIPHYVLDMPGKKGKVPLFPAGAGGDPPGRG